MIPNMINKRVDFHSYIFREYYVKMFNNFRFVEILLNFNLLILIFIVTFYVNLTPNFVSIFISMSN